MKMYISNTSLRLVGKAWQIRAALRQFANSQATLQAYLSAHHQQAKK